MAEVVITAQEHIADKFHGSHCDDTDTVFTCLFCNHEKAVSCKIDDKARIGYLSCKICGQKFSADTNPLDQPIDVYSLWIDACEDVANEQER